MKTLLSLAGLVMLLAQPAGSAAREWAALPVAGSTRQSVVWPSRRTIRAQVRQAGPSVRSGRILIEELALDATFRSAEPSVSLRYPSSWELSDTPQYTAPLTLVALFLSPASPSQTVRQNVNLVTEELASDLTLAQYTELGLAIEQNFFADYSIVSSENTRLAGAYPAHKVIFTARVGQDTMQFEQIWTLRGRIAHVWTFADNAKSFSVNVKTFERMMDTLVIR